jgi:hypothetical protein
LCEDGLYGSFCDLGYVIGNDGSNEFYEEINIVDVTSKIERPADKTERLAVPTFDALISLGANLWTAQFWCELKKSTLTGM